MSGNNPYGNQPQQPNQGQPNQGQPNQPGPQYGGPGYSGQPYGHPQQPYSQPTPSGPYPPYQGPGGPQDPGGPQQPYGMYNPGPPQQPKKSNKLPLIIGAGVLALVLIGTIIGIAVVRGGADPVAGGGTGGGGGASSAPPAEAKKPSDAVQAYLEALAAGDAQTALAFASTQPVDTTFLTNEMLAASNKVAPISAINVPVVDDEYAYRVSASYKLGSQSVNADFSVEKDGDAWKLRDVANDLDLSSRLNKTLPMLINGVQVESSKISLFPGSYQFTTGSKNVDYGKSNVLAIESPSDYPRGLSKITPTLTSAGEKAFTDAVEDSVKKCMKSKDLKNKNCPNTVTRIRGGSVTPKEGTFKWTYDKDALDNLKVRLDYDNPAVASSYVYLSMKAEGDCKEGPCRITPFSSPKPSANLMASSIKVNWTN